MADIFLSYARKDAARIKFLIDGLESEGWTVWWDAHIIPGTSFAHVIERELTKSKCIVVVWSRSSTQSKWVRKEASFGRERQTLVPVMIDNVKIPAAFSHIETASLKRWSKNSTNLEQVNFIKALRAIKKRRRSHLEFVDSRTNYERSIFLNCPFDNDYQPLFEALAFTTLFCGFQPRTVFEIPDAGEARLEKIFKLIGSCKYGVHDISRTELTERLPRFNIPFELGLFFGAQRFDPLQVRQKQSVILDKHRYRYQQFISDLAGIDVMNHDGRAQQMVRTIRDWLRNNSGDRDIPGSQLIAKQFALYKKTVKASAARALTYAEIISTMTQWIRLNASESSF